MKNELAEILAEFTDEQIAEALAFKKEKEAQWPKKAVMYLHSDRESNYELGAALGLDNEAQDLFQGTGYEVQFDLIVNKDGSATLVGINGTELTTPITNF